MVAAAILLTASVLGSQGPARTPAWLYDHGHFQELRVLTQKRLASNPNDADALAWAARVLVVAGDRRAAIASAERAIAVAPTKVLGHLVLAEALGEEADHVTVFRQIALARRARQALDAAVAIDPDNIHALGGLMQYYDRVPGVLGGSVAKADELAARITAVNPAEGLLRRARMMTRRKQHAKAEELYRKALAANPDDVATRVALAHLYSANPGRLAEAETHARAARALDPDRVEPYRLLAAIYARGERWAELDAILAQSDRHHPANLIAMFAAAAELAASGSDRPRAERYLKRYLSQQPELGAPSYADARRLLARLTR